MYHIEFPKCIHGYKWFGKGYFKYLVLYVLRDGPKHGYEISKAINSLFKGIYEPSPGLLYPTLKSMEKNGLITSNIDAENRRIYQITQHGLKELSKREKKIAEMLSEINSFLDSGVIELIKALTGIMRTLRIYYPELDSEKISKICSLLRDVRKKIEIIAEGEE